MAPETRFDQRVGPTVSTLVPVSPGAGSSGFSSRALVFGDSVGSLINAGAPQWDSTLAALGINTTAPQAQLHVVSGTSETARFESRASSGGLNSLVLNNASTSVDAVYGVGWLSQDTAGTSQLLGGVQMRHTSNAPGAGESRLAFLTRGTTTPAERMTINSSGEVGVGTTSPTNSLHVNGGLTVEGVGAAGGFNFRRGAVSSGIAGTLQFQGQDISATTAGMTYASLQGFITVASTSIPQSELRFRVSNASSVLTQAMTLNSSGDLGVGTSAPASRMHVLTSVNGNAFRVDATTGSTSGLSTAQPAFNIQSTGSTSKIGFWTTVGATRGAAYTPKTTATRVVPTTGSTITPSGQSLNDLINVVSNLITDLQAFGLIA